MQHLLDTSICVYIANRKPEHVLQRFQRMRPRDLGMSVVTYLELVYGAWKSQRVRANLAAIERLRFLIPVQPLDAGVADHYGKIRSKLELRGSPIGAYDLLIAAHAMSLDLILVTNNVREFSRIKGLRLENWAE